MLRAFRLTLSLLLIPRLFISLLLVPTALSIIVVSAQLLLTNNMLGVVNRSPKEEKQRFEKTPETQSALRKLIFRTSDELPDLKVCTWHINTSGVEVSDDPPNCPIDPYDIILRTNDPKALTLDPYISIFNKNAIRLHICNSCRSNIVIEAEKTPPSTHAFTIWSLFLLGTIKYRQQSEHLVHAFDEVDKVDRVIGKRFLHIAGMLRPASLDDLADTAGVIANIALLIIIALWLALRAHRKVLDYFAHSGVLLPLVAATGSQVFYTSIWMLTFLRVFAFLGTSIPMVYIFLKRTVQSGGVEQLFFNGEGAAFVLWLCALLSSFSLAGIISSVSDLKHRHSFWSLVYKYIPLVLCLTGSIIWAGSFLAPGTVGQIARQIITALPLVGMVPILLSPVFIPFQGILVINTILTVAIIVPLVKINTRWFAAHLDEL